MEIVTPNPGLFFWTTLFFILTLIILRKVAFKPIAEVLAARQQKIEMALQNADKAREEVQKIQQQLAEKQNEEKALRENLLKEAKTEADRMLANARNEAREQREKIITDAAMEIQNQKEAAKKEIKNLISVFSIDIAEKVLLEKLNDTEQQSQLINRYIDDLTI